MTAEAVTAHLARLYQESVQEDYGCFFVSAITVATKLDTLKPNDLPRDLEETFTFFTGYHSGGRGFVNSNHFAATLKRVGVTLSHYLVCQPAERYQSHLGFNNTKIVPFPGQLKHQAQSSSPCIVAGFRERRGNSSTNFDHHVIPFTNDSWTNQAFVQARRELGYRPFAILSVRPGR